MKKQNQRNLCIALFLLVSFALWSFGVGCVDLQVIGPRDSSVGFATLNGFVHKLTGVNMTLYTITDWLGLVPLCVVLAFAILGLIQLIKRRSILKVDYSILVLGGFYLVVMVAYVLFEMCVVNYRPILIEGYLEASYPSSTTMLVMCVMPTAVMQFNARIRNVWLRKCTTVIVISFTAFMVIGRLISGVHWFTDIIGGALLSAGLVMLYYSVSNWYKRM